MALSSSRLVVLGLQGSGKTTLVKKLISNRRHIVLDPLMEYVGMNQYPGTTESFFTYIRQWGSGTVVLEEAPRYLGRKQVYKPALTYMDEHRHFDQAVIIIARRPVQLATDVVDLATGMIIFRLPGSHDYAELEAISDGLGDRARELRGHAWLYVSEERDIISSEELSRKD